MKDAKKEDIEKAIPVEEPVIETTEIIMDLAPASGGAIVHNGVMYLNRAKYTVRPEVARDLLEIQNRGWAHEKSLEKNENANRRNHRAYV